MRLKAVKLRNFRGYQETTTVFLDENLTGIVGRNDYGKSTVLEALSIFFDGDIKPDRDDLNRFSRAASFEIACVFDKLPEKIIIDENVKTSLKDEFLLNEEGDLEIVKSYKGASGRLDLTGIRCLHPSHDQTKDLLSLKLPDLKTRGAEVDVQNVIDKRISSLWRQAIREKLGTKQCSLTLLNVDKDFSTEGKSIWGKIQACLPTFALFRADRESSDVDPEAKNPLQQAVTEAKAALQKEISEIEQRIEKSVLDVASRTLEKLREMAPELASELTPKFKDKPKWTFNFSLDGENGIPINKRGSGVRRLILLNFFRAEAEKKSTENNSPNIIYAIEEPESSQHPNYQVMLMKALLELSNQESRQIIVTTHVPALAGLIPIEGVRYVTKDREGKPQVKMPDGNVLKMAAESLGILPETGIERAKALILVEGRSDITFLRHASNELKQAGILDSSLDDKKILPILVGGSGNIKHWVTYTLADEIGLPWCVFMDSDIGGDPIQVKANLKRKQEVEGSGRPYFSTKKREIENYLCPELLHDRLGIKVEFTDTCDAKKIIGTAARVSGDDVIDKFWPFMKAGQIMARAKYEENGTQGDELEELIRNIFKLVD